MSERAKSNGEEGKKEELLKCCLSSLSLWVGFMADISRRRRRRGGGGDAVGSRRARALMIYSQSVSGGKGGRKEEGR